MDKEYILKEIDRTAKENGGVPLGRDRFAKETGIKYWDWYGKYWARWNDALAEAGYPPNEMQPAYDEELLIEKVITFIREIGKLPTVAEFRLKAHNSSDFPSQTTIYSRLGKQSELPSRLLVYCEEKPEYSDIADICRGAVTVAEEAPERYSQKPDIEFGYVYLMKFGRYYKIGRSSNVERRNYELGTKLPEDLKLIHKIRTDDPIGIESYWHNRFKDKRTRGEYFALSTEDISAFRRRKFM